ncbi:cofactor assembly of complex C subunit B [Lyngbya confervoides]|uniref:Cofactor assembly of complex C subunit B n=1 Tax=Lyngbya confervoides BDU141951 TaxID=1574623 RepID=A0ABD4T3V3_9CYAN|nr:cofactor assembly of complex C subunit B [Lyngbya confervoides]MCM1983373.1 cofactor assembly of complex C subunit B [Lyngbya confervoides BDU141951]
MTSQTVIPSTLFLTILLMIGLFFFVRASIKDRTEQMEWVTDAPGEEVLSRVETLLKSRAYTLTQVKPEESTAIFEGLVRPSLGLALLLVSLVACGLMAFSIVLSLSMPWVGLRFLGLVLLSPLAGFFYWRGAERVEQVVVQIVAPSPDASQTPRTQLQISAHRDELLVLQSALPYQVV